MFDLVIAWLVYPVILMVTCAGLGLAFLGGRNDDRGAGLFESLLLGFAALVALSQVLVWGALGSVFFLLVCGGLVGVGLYRFWAETRTSVAPIPFVILPVVFGLAAAPIVASGTATFTGYTQLGDTAVQMLGAQALVTMGPGSAPESSSELVTQAYFVGSGYPSGALTAAAPFSQLVAQDVAWTYQPFLAVAVVMLAAGLFCLSRDLPISTASQVGVTFIATQPGLLIAYYLQGSVKEVVAAAFVPALAVFIGRAATRSKSEEKLAGLMPVAVVSAALVGVVGTAAAVWIAPAALVLGTLVWRPVCRRPGDAAVALGVAMLVGVVGSIRAVIGLRAYLDVAGTVTTTQTELGNLITPLRKIEALGVWLNGDFRVPPEGVASDITTLMQVIVAMGLVLGVAYLLRVRAVASGVFLLVSVAGLVTISAFGSPWADAKAYAIAAPTLLFTGVVGWLGLPAWLSKRGQWLAVPAVGMIAVGVVASNALSYRDVSLAPRDRMEELKAIAERTDGPLLFTEFDEFAKYFLRDAAPDVAADTWRMRPPAFALGSSQPPYGTSVRAEALDRSYLAEFARVVVRRSALAERPASMFELEHRGAFYEVWRRVSAEGSTAASIAAGPTRTGWRIDCVQLAAAVKEIRPRRLLWQPRAPTAEATFERVPATWLATGAGPDYEPNEGGTGRGSVRVPEPGRYEVWLQGSVGAVSSVVVDDKPVGIASGRLNEDGGAELVGTVVVSSGTATWSVSVEPSIFRPGHGSSNRWVSGLALRKVGGPLDVREWATGRWRKLCREDVAWVELVDRQRTK